jgi:segregation and condensation protein B
MSLKAKLEAVIYAAEEPVTLAQLATLFASDVLEWKAEQEALTTAHAAVPADEATPIPELLPPLAEQLSHIGLGLEDSAAPSSADAPVESATEPQSDSTPLLNPEAAEEAEAKPSEGSQDSELEARRLVRLRDREARTIVRTVLDELIADYASDARGVEIREIAGGFRMATKPECHDAVRSFVKSLKPALKLSLPALETLAVIAYKQPVTAPEVNEIRGVDSSGVFGSLLARKLIATAGRKPVIGRPILYKTTREFLLRFGLKDVSELPSMEEFEKLASQELDEPETSSGGNAAGAAASKPELEFDLEVNEADDDELSNESLSSPSQTTHPTPTAEMADSNGLSRSEEAAPAAPPATEQAETENSPHGEEVEKEK